MAATLRKQLFAAAEEGDLAKLQAALSYGASVDARDGEGRVALHVAAAAGHAALVRALLAAGSNAARRRPEDERTALHLAAEEGHVEVVSELLATSDGAAAAELLSVGDFDGSTPLHCAAHYGNVRVVQALLDAGAKVLVRNFGGQTPLLVAAEASGCRWMGRPEGPDGYDYGEVVRRLLRAAEAEVETGAAEAEAEVHEAGAAASGGGAGGRAAVRPVSVGCEVDASGEGAAHAAVRAGNVQVVAALCQARAGIATAGPRGVTPLHLAAAAGQTECLRLLAAAGAPLEARETEGGLTPLHVAVQSRQPQALEALIDLGADPAAPDSRGLTPLHTAAQEGAAGVRMLQALLGALPPAPAGTASTSAVNSSANAQRVTPLHMAAAALALATPCPGAASEAGSQGGHTQAPDTLAQVACKEAGGAGAADPAVCALLEAGADVVAVDSAGNTPLHVAAARGHVAALRALMEAPEATPAAAARNTHGLTAEQLAVTGGHMSAARLLAPK